MTGGVHSVWVSWRLLRRGGIENGGMPGIVNKPRIVNYCVGGIVYCGVPGVVNSWKSRVVNWWMGRIVNR